MGFVLSAFADEINEKLSIQMDVLETHGIKHIEMRGVNGRNFTAYSVEEAKEIKNQLDGRGFKLSAVGSPIGKIKMTDDFAPHMELFLHTLELARIMETDYIRLFSFYMEPLEYEKYRDEVMERLGRFAQAAEGSGITLLHENEKGIYGDTPARCLDIFETLKSPVLRATFDPANFVQCGVDTVEALDMLFPYIEYLHIKDAMFEDGSIVPAGQGDGKIKEVLRRLKENGFNGFLSLEPHLGAFAGSKALERNGKFKDAADSGEKLFEIAKLALDDVLAVI